MSALGTTCSVVMLASWVVGIACGNPLMGIFWGAIACSLLVIVLGG